ncbi:hypothetical protein GCM10023231_07950 [Olivibacter ginsenosidimutans]|uniref:HTH luxR-type domain-containing protein n=1 Tax=Olivibacter ginsenosidimutans TaxID=1176537 RepID=A0ABP9AP94_9SPHI
MRTCWIFFISLCILSYGFTSAAPPSAKAEPASIPYAGTPFVQNYSKITYQGGNQNWALSCGTDGQLYIANNDGLLIFDGQHWQLAHMPRNVVVRSVAVDEKGRVYTGGFGEFGFWERDRYGQLAYHSLSKQLGEQDKLHDEIWKIYVDRDQVLFQSFSSIYTYRQGKLHVVKTKSPFLFLFQAQGRYLIEVIAEGLFEFKQDKLIKLVDKEAYRDSRILSVLPFQDSSLLIGTAQQGLFVLTHHQLSPWNNDANEALKRFQLNNGLQILGSYYAFGTILNGVYLVDRKGQLIQHVNKGNGLQNNTVLSLQRDQSENLWVGLDNGIDRIEVNSPIYYYDDRAGTLGTVYTSKIFQEKLYIGTNQGLYVSRWPTKSNLFDFQLIEGSQGQVWDLSVIGNQLLCGHNNGTFTLKGDKIQWLSTITGGYILTPNQTNGKQLLQGTYTGLVLFRFQDSQWRLDQKIANFNEPVQYLQQIGSGKLWVSGYKGLYWLQLSHDGYRVAQQKQYTEKEGLPNSPYVNVFDLAGRTVFATDSGFYLYDEIADRFHAYEQLNERLGTFSNANRIVPVGDGRYWFIRKGHLALVAFGEGGKASIDSTQFGVLSNRMISYYENVSRLTPDLSLISLDDGFALYRKQKQLRPNVLGKPLIQKVEDIADSAAVLLAFNGATNLGLKARQNNLRITFSLPYYTANVVLFQYLLEGNAKNWSVWSDITQKEFTNLPSGEYVFKVRALINGQMTSVNRFSFEIYPPWYNSKWAWFAYVLIVLLILLVLRNTYRYKLQKHRDEVRQKMLMAQEERLKQEAIENEQRLVKLKNSQLEKELASKNRELANSAMNIVYKNELLNNVHDELLQLKDGEGRKLSGDQLKKISKIIDDARSDERDWNLFEESFNEAHENFFKKLKINYPELVPNDLKLCAYLRMNMSSKEIASLLNITTRGVEIRRYRLRKKLNLEHDRNLTEFLLEI